MDLFPKAFQSDLADLMRWRRDVRRFRSDPVDDALVQECLETFLFAPSVGLSEPWRVIRVESTEARAAACKNFQIANQDALQGYSGEKAVLYAGLKLSGMRDAPVHLAVYCDEATDKGSGLGAKPCPKCDGIQSSARSICSGWRRARGAWVLDGSLFWTKHNWRRI